MYFIFQFKTVAKWIVNVHCALTTSTCTPLLLCSADLYIDVTGAHAADGHAARMVQSESGHLYETTPSTGASPSTSTVQQAPVESLYKVVRLSSTRGRARAGEPTPVTRVGADVEATVRNAAGGTEVLYTESSTGDIYKIPTPVISLADGSGATAASTQPLYASADNDSSIV